MNPTKIPDKNVARPEVGLFSAVVIVASLGYFVDIYDLVLFSIVRVKSLNGIGITEAAAVTNEGLYLLNMQMGGMLLGGILWGVLGDKRGRLSVLFGSILLYSLANIANGFVQTTDQYGWLRLIAGIGLAGELGAGITLVSESLPKEKRGYGTMIVASVGVSGAMVAYWVGEGFGWRNAYFIGGGLGLLLLALRAGVFESGMFEQTKRTNVARGNFGSLFTNGARLGKYLRCLLVGVPFWFLAGILITLAPEFGKVFNLQGPVTGGLSIFWCYFGLTLGDFTSGGTQPAVQKPDAHTAGVYLASAVAVAVYLFGPERRQHHRILRRVLFRGVRRGLLGPVRDGVGRGVWHQPAVDRGHHGAQLCPRGLGAGHHRLQGAEGHSRVGHGGGRGRDWGRVARVGLHQCQHPAGNVRQRPGLRRGELSAAKAPYSRAPAPVGAALAKRDGYWGRGNSVGRGAV
jgi:MFS family permease